jgi:hypothetical protein
MALANGAAATPAPGCDNPAESALNQYCDAVPTAVGAKPPTLGSPSLRSSLPPQALRRLRASGLGAAARRRLLSLPAPTKPAHPAQTAAGSASLWSLALWMILLLAAIALALTAVAARRRRRRPTPRIA